MHGAGQGRRGCRGTLMADALIGLAIASVLLLGVGLLIVQQSRAERKLAEVRREMRVLETSLLELQATGKRSDGVEVQELLDKSPTGQTWMRVTKKGTSGQVRSLVGLVPVRFAKAPATGATDGGAGHE